jgi:hypothetical protein
MAVGSFCPLHQKWMNLVLQTFLLCANSFFLSSSCSADSAIHDFSLGFSQSPTLNLRQKSSSLCPMIRSNGSPTELLKSSFRKVHQSSISQTLAILSMGDKSDGARAHDGFDFVPRRGEMNDATVTHFEFIAECELPTERQSPHRTSLATQRWDTFILFHATTTTQLHQPSPARPLTRPLPSAEASSASAPTASKAPKW